LRVIKKKRRRSSVFRVEDLHDGVCTICREREFFIDNLLVRIQLIIVMIRWTGLAPWEFVPYVEEY